MNHFFTTVKKMRSSPSNSGYLKNHELESWPNHSSRNGPQKSPDNLFLPSQNDQAQLISTAAGPAHREGSITSLRSEAYTTSHDGISKNITVSQSFEVVES